MVEGEKTIVFWIGLILLASASVALFGIFWIVAVVLYPANRMEFLKGIVPLIVGGFVFVLLGLYMMRSGIEKSQG